MVLLASFVYPLLFASGETASELARGYAISVGVGILASVVLDYRGQLRNLVRADLMGIASLYFLTLFEFLLLQPDFNNLVSVGEVRPALDAVLMGFVGLAVGRHFAPAPPRGLQQMLRREFSARAFLGIYTVSLIGGYLHMLLAVNFDFMEMLHYFTTPRFTQPWTRGRFGDWKALLGEIGMLLYLVPPVAGIVFARRNEYRARHLVFVTITFLFTLFYGYASGTRNIFATYLATFLVAYTFALDPTRKKELFAIGSLAAALMLFATVTMLEFRNIGFEAYFAGYREEQTEKRETTFFVDYNLYVISKLVGLFPRHHEFLGLEIPYLSIIRPIPRALWSGKPEGLSISIEDAVGVEGLTLASSFVGEAYMSGGMVGVLLTAMVFGVVNGWWNRFGRADNSAFGHLVFASGFFAAVISMRSMFVFTTAILPTIAALVIGNWLLGFRPRRRAQHATSE